MTHFSRTITWGKDTRRLQRLLLKLDFTQVVQLGEKNFRHILPGGATMVGERAFKVLALLGSLLWGSGSRRHWILREEELRKEIQQEQEVVFRSV